MFFLLVQCNEKAAKEKYLIPYGFKGQVFIFFNIKDGAKKEYENGYRIYKIPASGILKTQFKPTFGYQSFKKKEVIFVYVDSLNKEYPLEIKSSGFKKNEMSQAYIMDGSNGIYGVRDEYPYETFIVKSPKDTIIKARYDVEMMDSVLKKAGLSLD